MAGQDRAGRGRAGWGGAGQDKRGVASPTSASLLAAVQQDDKRSRAGRFVKDKHFRVNPDVSAINAPSASPLAR